MIPVQFTGIDQTFNDEQTPFDRALDAFNCVLDDGRPRRRNGYRRCSASSIAGTGTVQAFARFRPSASSARTAAVVAGTVYVMTDPTSETASDASITSIGSPFSGSARISMAQMGKYMYIGTDEADVPMRRITPGYALETIENLQKGAPPDASLGSLSFVVYRSAGLSYTTSTDLSLQTSGIPSTWYRARNAANTNDCLVGEFVYFTLAANEDWRHAKWVAVACSPHDTGSKDGSLKISVARQVSGSPGTFEEIGTIWDTPGQGGTPNLIFCSLETLSEETRQAVRYIRFEIATGKPSSRYTFAVYGHCVLPNPPQFSPEKYYVDFFKSGTGQSSPLSDAREVTIRDEDVVVPTYVDLYLDRGVWRSQGNRQLISGGNDRNFNRFAGQAYPTSKAEIGVRVTLSGNAPTGFTGTVEARVWKDTASGRRLVGSQTGVSSGGSYSVVDYGGYRVLAALRYKPGGTPPRCTALSARAQRLIAGFENRLYISSYTPPGADTDQFPIFPDIPEEDSDGWSFDIAPSNAEQIQALVNGDGLYILTNHNVYVMTDLEPNSTPYLIFARGCVGRRAAVFAEDMLFWCAYDGVYAARNRVETQELSVPVRRYYTEWLGVGPDTVISYQDRKLYVFRGSRFLCYDFVRGSWVRGETAHAVTAAAAWYDPGASLQQMWFVLSDRHAVRWQKSAETDAGTAISGWRYHTGYIWSENPMMPRFAYLDCSGIVEVRYRTSGGEGAPGAMLDFDSAAAQKPFPPVPRSHQARFEFEGKRDASIARAVVWMEPISARGQAGGKAGLVE